jgi:hypothetical protein
MVRLVCFLYTIMRSSVLPGKGNNLILEEVK